MRSDFGRRHVTVFVFSVAAVLALKAPGAVGISLSSFAKGLGIDVAFDSTAVRNSNIGSESLDAMGKASIEHAEVRSDENKHGVFSGFQHLRAFQQHASKDDVGKVVSELRHYTEETGCVSPTNETKQTMPLDECSLNYRRTAGRGEEHCTDSYFGGKPGCCWDERLQNCTSCVVSESCSVASLLCAMSYLEACGTNNSNFDFSSTFALRKSSCLYGVSGSYWQHPGYLFRGQFQALSPVGGVRTADGCADSCSTMEDCNAFAFVASERLCLLQHVESYSLCNMATGEPDCVSDGRDWYVLDDNDLYCSELSAECACTREYFGCMVGYGCQGSEEEICAFGDMCTERGCSAEQCGIGFVNSTGFLSTCANQYFACMVDNDGSCSCTRTYVECMALDPNYNPNGQDENSGMTVIEMCNQEGCSADACGLAGDFCNSTSLHCGHEYMSCVGGAFGDAGWDDAEEPAEGDFAAGFLHVRDGGLTASWPPLPVGVFGGVRTTFGVDHGKVYWEVLVSGVCAVAGVGTENHDPFLHPGVDDRSWAYGDVGQGGRLLNGLFVPFGPAFTGPTVIGIALDASAGLLWFAADGVWLGGGDPAAGFNPAYTMNVEPGISLYPIAGTRCPPSSPQNVTVEGRFSDSLIQYPIPEGFNAYESSECTCSVNFRRCMTAGSCGGHQLMHEVYESCIEAGCALSECGSEVIPPRGQECDGQVPFVCNSEFLLCSSHRDQCECTQEMFECMAAEGCQMDETTLEKYGELCAIHGCSAEQCGLCAPTCNRTEALCRHTYMNCTEQMTVQLSPNETITITTKCACDATYYQCMLSGGCVSDDVSVEHAIMCLDHKCTASECGLEQQFQQCNETNLICSERFLACQETRLPPEQDRCATNYRRGNGAEFCSNPVFGGIAGCQFDDATDSCFTSGDCMCSSEYVSCMKGACVNSESTLAFAETCVQKGCTASQCGLDRFYCNQTALICANSYLQCQLSDQAAETDMAPADEEEDGEELPWCASSFCLRTYFDCMSDALCTSEEDLSEHLQICALAGCTPEQCGVDLIFEPSRLPDAPNAVTLLSVISKRMDASWQHSALAFQWARQGSRNAVLQYLVAFEGDCVRVQGETYDCSRLLANQTVPFSAASSVRFGGGLVIGERYRASVFAINTNGTGPPGLETARLAGPPKEPQAVTAERVGPRAASVGWLLPLDTGDTTLDVLIEGYEVEVTPFSGGTPAVFAVSQRSLLLQSFVGGTFVQRATYNRPFTCHGLARFGRNNAWSPPVQVRGTIICVDGEAFSTGGFPETMFPDILPGDTEVCQCNEQGQALVAGKNMSARVLAINYVGKGNYSVPSSVKIMGEPSAVRSIQATEFSTYASISFVPPEDTGFGVNDRSAPILSYSVYVSTCESFDSTQGNCVVRQTVLPPTACDENQCSYQLQEAGNLEEGVIYFLRVVAENPVASGFLSLVEWAKLPWKVFPTITFPLASVFPLRTAEWDGSSVFWVADKSSTTVNVIVLHFPKVGGDLFIPFTKDGVTVNLKLTVVGREKTTPTADLDDPLGIEVSTTFSVQAPFFGAGPGSVAGSVALSSNPTKSFDLSFEFFEYPDPTVNLLTPSAGPLGGGNLVRVQILEPRGQETRVGAGLVNFHTATLGDIGIVLNGTLFSALQSKNTAATDPNSVDIFFRPPASPNTNDEVVPLTFTLGGNLFQMTEATQYKYRGAFIQSLTPSDGLTTGGSIITVIARDFGSIDLNSNLRLTFDGTQQTVDLSLSSVDTTQQTTLIAETVGGAAGSVTVGLLVDRIGASAIYVEATNLFTYVVPPSPEIVISSLRVTDRPGQLWVATTASGGTQVEFEVKHMYVGAGESLRVQFLVPYTSTAAGNTFTGTVTNTLSIGDPPTDDRFTSTVVTVLAPATNPQEGFGHIRVILTKDSDGSEISRAVTGDTAQVGPLEFRDIRVPLVVGAGPSEGSPVGGQIVLAGLTGFKSTTQGFTASFASQSSDQNQLASISLSAWQVGESGQAYQELRSAAGLEEFFTNLGSGTQAVLDSIVDQVSAQVEADSSLTTSNSFLAFFRVPALSGVTAAQAETVTVKTSTSSATFTFTYIPDPIGPAIVQSLVPSSGVQSLRQLITLTVTNFAIVVYPSDVTVTFGSQPVTAVIVSSTSRNTQLAVLTSAQVLPGFRTILAYPTRQPSNNVSAQYEYLDERSPVIESIVPSPVYADGGTTVTATLSNFGDPAILASQITISLLSGGVSTNPGVVSVSWNAFSSEVTLSFVTTSGVAGETLVTIAYQRDSASAVKSGRRDLTYLAIPTGDATMTINPSTGFTSGGASIVALLSNFKKASPSDVVVLFGTQTIPAASLTVQSGTAQTKVTFVTPSAAAGGTVTVRIYATGRQANSGFAQFIYEDNNQAALTYARPSVGQAAESTEVDVGIVNLGVIVSSGSAFVVSPSAVTISRIVASTLESTNLFLTVPSSLIVLGDILTQQQSITIEIRLGGVVGDKKTVRFQFSYIPAGALFVHLYTPTQAYTDGGLSMTIDLRNFPKTMTSQHRVQVVFGDGGSVANATSLQIDTSSTSDVVDATVGVTIPASDVSAVVTPFVRILGLGVTASFQGTFSYLDSPFPVISQVFPTEGPIDSRTTVTISLGFFPGVARLTDILVFFGDIEAEVTSFTRDNEALDPMDVQGIAVTVRSPCCTGSIVPSLVDILAYHRFYDFRSVLDAQAFRYYSNSLPNVVSVTGVFENNVKTSEASPVTVVIRTVPLQVNGVEDAAITMDNGATLLSVLYLENTANGVATIRFAAPTSNSAGEKTVQIQFLSNADYTVNFEINYYSGPVITRLAPSEGTSFGGDQVTVSLSDFPTITTPADVSVRFGTTGAFFGSVLQVSESNGVTSLVLLTPEFDVGATGFANVQVQVTPIAQENLVSAPRNFLFVEPAVELASFQPIRGVYRGGTTINAILNNFPRDSTPGSVRVKFGGVLVAAENITVPLSSRSTTQLVIIAPPGTVSTTPVLVKIFDSALGEASALTAQFTYFDDKAIQIAQPLPRRACYSTSGQTAVLNIKFPPFDAVAADYTFVFRASSGDVQTTATAQVDLGDRQFQISFPLPNLAVIETMALSVLFQGNELDSIDFDVYNCNEPLVLSFAPTKGIYSGGNFINVRVSSFPEAAGGGYTVLFGGNTAATVQSFVVDSSSTAAIQILSPEMGVLGMVAVTITGTFSVTFDFEVVSPPDFFACCGQDGRTPDPRAIANNPPVDDTCLGRYCIDPNAIPFPSLVSVTPTEGPTQGSTTVATLLMQGFPALSLDDVTITVGTSTTFASPTSLSTDSTDVLTAVSTLTFAMPNSPIGAGSAVVIVVGRFNDDVSREFQFTFDYYTPISGNPVVTLFRPTSIRRGLSSETIYFEISNFPLIEDTSSNSLIRFSSSQGSGTASAIFESTRASTQAQIVLTSLNLASVSQLDISIYYDLHPSTRAAVVSLIVENDPDPVVTSAFPNQGLLGQAHVVAMVISNMFNGGNVNAAALTASVDGDSSLASISSSPAPAFVRTCSGYFCSPISVTVVASASVPTAGTKAITVCRTSSPTTCAALDFLFIAPDAPFVDQVVPQTGLSTASTAVRIFVQNLGTVDFASDLVVTVGGLSAQGISMVADAEAAGSYTISATIPASNNPGTVQGQVYKASAGQELAAVFTFEYLQPAAQYSPIDMPTSFAGDAELITIEAFWGGGNDGIITNIADVVVNFDGVAGTVRSLESNLVSTTVQVETPTGLNSGFVTVTVTAKGTYETSFLFEFFDPPFFFDVQPRLATVDGTVGDCPSCLRNDGESLTLTVKEFPPITGIDDVQVTFQTATTTIVCDGTACALGLFANLGDGLALTVSVPAFRETGLDLSARITISFEGDPLPPPGGSSSQTYIRSARVASTTLFSYFIPSPSVALVQWCRVCESDSSTTSCLVAGQCANGILPATGSKRSGSDLFTIALPNSGGGVLVLTVESLNVGNDASFELAVTIGGITAQLRRSQLIATNGRTVIEVIPAVSSQLGEQNANIDFVANGLTRSAEFSALLYDANMVMTCQSGCEGGADGGQAATLSITNFPIVQTSDEVIVKFGSAITLDVTIVSSVPSATVFTVLSPACSSCSFVAGVAQVSLRIESASSPTDGSEISYLYYSAPKISEAIFNTVGTAVMVTFDQATNMNAGTCIGPTSILGTNPTCVWSNSRILSVTLGTSATIEPGTTITITGGGSLRSQNGLSPAANSATATVLPPTVVSEPGPITLIHPADIDQCSDFTVKATIPSSRPLSYSWRCPNNENLDTFLRTVQSDTVYLDISTPEMDTLDFDYEIQMTVTNFLGGTLRTPRVISVRKNGYPSPTITIFVRDSYKVSDTILIKGAAEYSNCNIEQSAMLFLWELESGAEDLALPSGNANQLYILPFTLSAGTYRVKLTVTSSTDATRTAAKSFDLVVTSTPELVAIINGGSILMFSQFTDIDLSAARSRDMMVRGSDDQGLSFSWSCVVKIGGVSSNCTDGTGAELVIPSTETLSLAAGTLLPSAAAQYFFTVEVSKGSSRATASTQVEITQLDIPAVQISHDIDTYSAAGIPKINALDRLRLRASSSVGRTSFDWDISPNVNLADPSANPLGRNGKVLQLVPRKCIVCPLFTAGVDYTITLTGTAVSSGLSGTSQLNVSINHPPTGECAACLSGTGGSTSVTCVTSGTALFDQFVMTCSNWNDEDTPLVYRYGFQGSNGIVHYMDPVLEDSRGFFLGSDTVALWAYVTDSLGAASEQKMSSIRVNSIGGRRRNLLSITTLLDTAVTNIQSQTQLGRADQVNLLASAVSKEVDLCFPAGSTTVTQAYKTSILTETDAVRATVAWTPGLAQETALSVHFTVAQACDLDASTVQTATALALWSSEVLRDAGTVADESATEYVVIIIGAVTQAQDGASCSAVGAAALSTAEVNSWMASLTSTALLIMTNAILVHSVGEPAVVVSGQYYSLSAAKADTSTIGGYSATVGTTVFTLPGADALFPGNAAGTVYDIIQNNQDLVDTATAAFSADFIATVFGGLTLTLDGAGTAQTISLTSANAIMIEIPINPTVAESFVGQFWRQKINCNFLDTANNQMSYAGCVQTGLVETSATVATLHCNCTHLTDFSAGVDPSIPVCGDGVIADNEECDDENVIASPADGCSDICAIQRDLGWDCAGSTKSICCGPCSPGKYRDGCTNLDANVQPESSRVSGVCVDCPVGQFKAVLGTYQSVCSDCSYGTYALGGASNCSNHEPCPAGTYKVGATTTSQGTCEACATGTYKDSPGTWETVCTALSACNPGEELQGYSASSAGTCVACEIGRYLTAGEYSETCIDCPPNAATPSQGSTVRTACVCDEIAYATIGGADATFCQDIDECTNIQVSRSPCPTNADCTNTVGSFSCACNTGYQDVPGYAVGTFPFACSPVCGDGLVYPCDGVQNCDDAVRCDDGGVQNGDGCSSLCTVEANWVCSDGSNSSASTCACATDYYPAGTCNTLCTADTTVATADAVGCATGYCHGDGGSCDSSGYCVCARYQFGCQCTINAVTTGTLVTSSDFTVNGTIDTVAQLSSGGSVLGSLTIPVGAIGAGTALTVDAYSTSLLTTIGATQPTGATYVSSVFNLGPEGTTFTTPVTVSFVSDIYPPAGEIIQIYYFNRATSAWETLTDSVYDNATQTVSVQLSHFSTYTAMSIAVPTTTTSTTTTPAPTTSSSSTTAEPTTPAVQPTGTNAVPGTTPSPGPTDAPGTTDAPGPTDPPPPPPPPPTGADTTAAPPPPDSTTTPEPTTSGGGSNIGIIAGGAAGAVLVLVAVGYVVYKRRAAGTVPIVPHHGDGLDAPLLNAPGAQTRTGVQQFSQPADPPMPVDGRPHTTDLPPRPVAESPEPGQPAPGRGAEMGEAVELGALGQDAPFAPIGGVSDQAAGANFGGASQQGQRTFLSDDNVVLGLGPDAFNPFAAEEESVTQAAGHNFGRKPSEDIWQASQESYRPPPRAAAAWGEPAEDRPPGSSA